jgi:hypothetical protein
MGSIWFGVILFGIYSDSTTAQIKPRQHQNTGLSCLTTKDCDYSPHNGSIIKNQVFTPGKNRD